MKPVANAPMNEAEMGTFSDMPCWIKSMERRVSPFKAPGVYHELTCISINPRSNLSSTQFIEKRYVLPQHGLQVILPDTSRVPFACPGPDNHIQVGGEETADADDDEVGCVFARFGAE